jgi:putative component of toxin-antitoxin plasmid stabilization module
VDAKWTIEFYEDAQGRRPVEKWIDGLSDQKAEAVIVALQELLAVNGINLASGAWLKPLGSGLYEFRIRHSKNEIQAMYKAANRGLAGGAEAILLRIFVAFEGQKLIVLLGGYDKGKKGKQGFQQTQIEIARKRLRDWKRRRA